MILEQNIKKSILPLMYNHIMVNIYKKKYKKSDSKWTQLEENWEQFYKILIIFMD